VAAVYRERPRAGFGDCDIWMAEEAIMAETVVESSVDVIPRGGGLMVVVVVVVVVVRSILGAGR